MPAKNPSNDDDIRRVVARLSRPHRSGGSVIERSAILAEGAGSAAIFQWINAHEGKAEITAPAAPPRGLYGTGFGGGDTPSRGPARYVLPTGALVP
jgi:hypothetical protein